MTEEPGAEIDPTVIVRAALETLVFAPIGLGAKFVDDAPAAVRRVRQELSNARFIGRLTVEQGAARLRQEAAEAHERSSQNSRGVKVDSPDEQDGLPIEGYDEMPAIEIVAVLETLTPAQRDAIAAHESAHRRRRTVLGKIAQLNA